MSRRRVLALSLVVAVAGVTTAAAVDGGAQTVEMSLSRAAIRFGGQVRLTGTVAPAAGDLPVAIEQRRGARWAQLATAVTDETGKFAVTLRPRRGGPVRARLVEGGAASAARTLHVAPIVRFTRHSGRAFIGARLVVRVFPKTYAGRARIVVSRAGRELDRASGRIRSGVGRLRVPAPGVGRFRVRVTLPEADGIDGTTISTRMRATARTVAYGSTGRDIRALTRRLAELRFHTPAPSSRFGPELFDAVVAFQKANGLSRTGVVSEAVWRRLGRAGPPKPRHATRNVHLEVDKTKQILLEVKGGRVRAVLPVSTGATGNTPEGAFRIRWKALATTTWLGPAILYRTMTFYGNNFAIHGYPEVPPYPASHGCVRIPMWAADWLYRRSHVGERVYVYR